MVFVGCTFICLLRKRLFQNYQGAEIGIYMYTCIKCTLGNQLALYPFLFELSDKAKHCQLYSKAAEIHFVT